MSLCFALLDASNFISPTKTSLSFALLDKWNVKYSIEKVKVYFSIVFYDKD